MLTDLGIKKLPAPAKGVKRYWDKDGLCLQVSQGGTKTFYLVQGDDRRFTKLGRYPVPLSLSDAREKVRTILAKQALGLEDETSPTTVQEAIDRFVDKHCKEKNKERTASETKRLLAYLAPLAKRKLVKIDTRAITETIDDASPSVSERRHLFTAVRTFLNWCCRERLVKTSPLQYLKPPGQPTVRTRLLTDNEMAKIYKAARILRDRGDQYGSICLIAIHTGMRRGEVGGLRRSFITDETISLPAWLAKNNRELVLPNLIADILALVPRSYETVINENGEPVERERDLLFPSSVGTPYSTWSDGKETLDEACKVESFVFHDFRRYLSTTMAKLRVPIDVTEAILNHVTGSRSPIQRVYDHYDRLPEMREALKLYERHLETITGAADPDN